MQEEWFCNEKNGFGSFAFEGGDRYVLDPRCFSGFFWANVHIFVNLLCRYAGTMKADLIDGEGHYLFKNRDSYHGHWRKGPGKMHGRGVYSNANETTYMMCDRNEIACVDMLLIILQAQGLLRTTLAILV
jgi:hypothetical protein